MEKNRNIQIIIILIIIVIIELFIGIFLFIRKQNLIPQIENISKNKASDIQVFYEKIPGSKFHGPDATWWGYNQNKIVRFKNLVFMYVVENIDDKNTTLSDLVIYKKGGDGLWEKGASFKTSRPGNILIDSKGVLHAFVFEPTNVLVNDSIGRLSHYSFPNSANGDITNYKEETVVDAKSGIETVNIRVGAAISKDDTMALGFGLTKFNPLYKGHSEHLYIKRPTDSSWRHLIAGEDLDHDWYYPFVWMGNNSYYLLPVQDDYNGPATPNLPYPNIYQKIMFLENSNNIWQGQVIADLSSNPMAKARPRLLEQEDLIEDKSGTVHFLYKEFLDKEYPFKATSHKHVTKTKDGFKTENVTVCGEDINWIRLFEVGSSLYYLCSSWDSVYIAKAKGGKAVKIAIPNDAKGFYPYVATRRGSSIVNDTFVDILLLSADAKVYENGNSVNYYLKINKKELTNKD